MTCAYSPGLATLWVPGLGPTLRKVRYRTGAQDIVSVCSSIGLATFRVTIGEIMVTIRVLAGHNKYVGNRHNRMCATQ